MHPELTLARRAAQELNEETVEETVMYTSTKPCSMCSTGMAFAEVRGVVYSVSGKLAVERWGGPAGISSKEVFERYDADVEILRAVG